MLLQGKYLFSPLFDLTLSCENEFEVVIAEHMIGLHLGFANLMLILILTKVIMRKTSNRFAEVTDILSFRHLRVLVQKDIVKLLIYYRFDF